MASSTKDFCKRCLCVSFAINVGLIIGIVCIYVKYGLNNEDGLGHVSPQYNEKDVHSSASVQIIQTNTSFDGGISGSSVCLYCDYLGDTVDVNDTLYEDIYSTGNQRKICCFKDRLIHDFVRAVQNKDEENANTSSIKKTFDWWRNRQASAHLYLDQRNPRTKENKLRWVDRDIYGTAFTKDVDLVNGTHIRINHSGAYFLYSSTSFSLGGREIMETFYQSITKFHPLLPRTGDVDLVFSKYGGAQSSTKQHTNFLAGVFELQPGYLISSSLSSSGHQYLDSSNLVTNYIGLYKL